MRIACVAGVRGNIACGIGGISYLGMDDWRSECWLLLCGSNGNEKKIGCGGVYCGFCNGFAACNEMHRLL